MMTIFAFAKCDFGYHNPMMTIFAFAKPNVGHHTLDDNHFYIRQARFWSSSPPVILIFI
ncbi:hypothetical protein [Ammoniphilus resinae]|uniref:hypothetical protein n=1 Tax=Ammoniphilus resinae TaxID=861532 RepID=UPI001AE5A64D|nr:hypothetical protein [Ammoniphilus resinae]